MWNIYPYKNLTDLNLDFILRAIGEMENQVKNFVAINAIKYANPIQWDITRSYEKNTVVIDGNSGVAYISVAPVPYGVALTRPEYWTVVFDLSMFITKGAANFANHYEVNPTTTATMNTNEGEWLVWDSTLFEALTNIHAGDTYVVNGNIKKMTVEDFYNIIFAALAQEVQDRQDEDARIYLELSDLITSQVDIVSGNLAQEVQDRQDEDVRIYLELSDLITSKVGIEAQTRADEDARIENELQNVIDNLIYTTPEEYGAVGDGVTDDSAAMQAAVNDGRVVYLRNEYAIDSIAITQDTTIIGGDTSKIYPNCVGSTILFKNVFTATNCNLTLKNVHIVGQGRYASTGDERYTLIVSESADYLDIIDCTIDNVGHNYAQNDTSFNNYIPLWVKAVDVLNVNIKGCTFSRGGSDELMMITPWTTGAPSKPSIKLSNNTFINCEHGASINLFAYDVAVNDNIFNNFVYAGSIFNLSGQNVICNNNIFSACNVGSVFDAIEGCIYLAERFTVANNVFRGTCNIFAQHDGGYGYCVNNNVDADTLFINEITVYDSNFAAPMLRNTTNRRLGRCVIKNNYCRIRGGNTSVIRAFSVGANHASDIPYTDYKAQSELIIKGNTFDYTEWFSSNNKFFAIITATPRLIDISDNEISNPNADGMGSEAKYLLTIDNRFINHGIKNLKFTNNVMSSSTLTQGLRLYTVMDSNYNAVDMLTNIGNNTTIGTVALGSTDYSKLIEVAPV